MCVGLMPVSTQPLYPKIVRLRRSMANEVKSMRGRKSMSIDRSDFKLSQALECCKSRQLYIHDVTSHHTYFYNLSVAFFTFLQLPTERKRYRPTAASVSSTAKVLIINKHVPPQLLPRMLDSLYLSPVCIQPIPSIY